MSFETNNNVQSQWYNVIWYENKEKEAGNDPLKREISRTFNREDIGG